MYMYLKIKRKDGSRLRRLLSPLEFAFRLEQFIALIHSGYKKKIEFFALLLFYFPSTNIFINIIILSLTPFTFFKKCNQDE